MLLERFCNKVFLLRLSENLGISIAHHGSSVVVASTLQARLIHLFSYTKYVTCTFRSIII